MPHTADAMLGPTPRPRPPLPMRCRGTVPTPQRQAAQPARLFVNKATRALATQPPAPWEVFGTVTGSCTLSRTQGVSKRPRSVASSVLAQFPSLASTLATCLLMRACVCSSPRAACRSNPSLVVSDANPWNCSLPTTSGLICATSCSTAGFTGPGFRTQCSQGVWQPATGNCVPSRYLPKVWVRKMTSCCRLDASAGGHCLALWPAHHRPGARDMPRHLCCRHVRAHHGAAAGQAGCLRWCVC